MHNIYVNSDAEGTLNNSAQHTKEKDEQYDDK